MMQIEIISAHNLIAQLKQGADCSIVDARTSDEFVRGHVKGAVSMLWEEWCQKPPTDCAAVLTEPGYWGLLADPAAESFAERLSAAGLSNSKPVVVYADGPASKGREGRIAWMLLYLGAEKSFLLDGGWSAWLNAHSFRNSPFSRGARSRSLAPTTSSLTAKSACGPLLLR